MKNADLPAAPVWCVNSDQQLYGLTKREYIAALAMQAVLSKPDVTMSYAAREGVMFADELLAELERTK